jgi:hypothetical protein
MVVGLSAAALQGAPVVTEDIDLWFDNLSDPKLMQALVKIGAAYIPPFGYNPPMLGGPGSEPFDVVIRMSGLGEFADEWKRALEIKVGKLKLKVMPLERILASKQAANHSYDEYYRRNQDGTISTTNGAESFFSLLKRGVYGSWHHVSREHLPKYANEFAFRWGTSKLTDGARNCHATAANVQKGKAGRRQRTKIRQELSGASF